MTPEERCGARGRDRWPVVAPRGYARGVLGSGARAHPDRQCVALPSRWARMTRPHGPLPWPGIPATKPATPRPAPQAPASGASATRA